MVKLCHPLVKGVPYAGIFTGAHDSTILFSNAGRGVKQLYGGVSDGRGCFPNHQRDEYG